MGGCCSGRENGKNQILNFTNEDYLRLRQLYEKENQGHIFNQYEDLDFINQQQLLLQATQVDPYEINKLYLDLVKEQGASSGDKKESDFMDSIESSAIAGKHEMTKEQIAEYSDIGLKKILFGKVAVIILAGGDGTRLGSDKPKGCYDINLPSRKSLFELIVDKFVRIQCIAHDSMFPSTVVQMCKLLIMTSPLNHNEIVEFFTQNNFFGAKKENVYFFDQGVVPAVDENGKILLEEAGKMQVSPNGNGALFEALKKEGNVQRALKGVEYVQITGVDNVLNRILDPVFLGYTIKKDFQASMKSCVKKGVKENVGVICKKNNKYAICEYTELTDQDAFAMDDSGNLKYNLGSILNFIIKTEKLQEICEDTDVLNKLYHKAFKKVPYYDVDKKETVTPAANNGYKFELFVHSFLSLIDPGKFGVLKVMRDEEFAPVKNAEGDAVDSPNVAKQMLFKLHKKWLYENGGKLEDENLPQFEIDYLLSYEGENIRELVEGKTFTSPFYLNQRELY